MNSIEGSVGFSVSKSFCLQFTVKATPVAALDSDTQLAP